MAGRPPTQWLLRRLRLFAWPFAIVLLGGTIQLCFWLFLLWSALSLDSNLAPPSPRLALALRHAWVANSAGTAIVIGGFIWLALRSIRLSRLAHRLSGQLCTRCLYDLSGPKGEGICPECGDAASAEDRRRFWGARFWTNP